MRKITKKGKCKLCDTNTDVHLFYYGFFKSNYDEKKWCYLCDNCRKKFILNSNISKIGIHNELWEMERELNSKTKCKKK